jgi:hypothetical protein
LLVINQEDVDFLLAGLGISLISSCCFGYAAALAPRIEYT